MGVRLPIIQDYLDKQQDLSVVERFAHLHESGEVDEEKGFYETQIPLTRPGPGQQYAFQVDLDACTGCKACVVGCNKLNGLDQDEAWRSVGTIHGGNVQAPIQQTVTSACHHCLDPACMHGCPVGAYEKDPETGIVRHLDDQCIGCQYCTLTCPYEVPQYNKRLGIVRKCDMCSDRLDEGEAPACVQSCPNGAISIRTVDVQEVLDDAQGDAFLPGAPSPGITGPTTVYKTERNLPRNVLPANFYNVTPADRHMPLVITLVLTQLSTGAFAVDALQNVTSQTAISGNMGKFHSLIAGLLGLVALVAGTFHLGRPQYAFRAFIGLRTSWMSREIVVFGLFVQLAAITALSYWKPEVLSWLGIPEALGLLVGQVQQGLVATTALIGFVGVICSVMIYVVTRRRWWSGTATSLKFIGSAAVLGLGTMAATSALASFVASSPAQVGILRQLLMWMAGLSAAKMAYEASMFFHLLDKQQGDMKRTALLMKTELSDLTTLRFVAGVLGGIVLPLLLLLVGPAHDSIGTLIATLAALALSTSGELLERILFFAAVSAPRMPGSVGK